MNKTTTNKKPSGALSLAAAVLIAAVTLTLTVLAVIDLGGMYKALANADPAGNIAGNLSYEDHFYAEIGFRIELTEEDGDREALLDAFLADSLAQIEQRAYAAFILYVTFACAALSYFLYAKRGKNAKDHTGWIVLTAVAAALLYFAVFAGTLAFFGIPLMPLPGEAVTSLGTSLLSAMGGCIVLGFLLRASRFKRVLAALAVPFVLVFFVTGVLCEGMLYTAPYTESFEYIASSVPEDYEGEFRYDPEKNAVILDGVAYPPQIQPNPDRAEGVPRIAAILFEALIPVAGNSLEMVRQIIEIPYPVWVLPLYAVKAFFWFFVCSLQPRKMKSGPDADIRRKDPN